MHWVDDHHTLFPRLTSWLNPGGVLAVQMPNNYHAPSHRLMHETAKSKPWAGRFPGVSETSAVLDAAGYYELLSPWARHVDIWETTYVHVLEGVDPVAQWTRSTGLRPFLGALADDEEREAFFIDYASRIRVEYPPQQDGRTLFPFRRLFLVANV